MPIEARNLTPLIEVFDMAMSVAFYRDRLGFRIVAQSSPGDSFGWGLLKMGSASLMLNTAYDAGERPPAPDPARIAAHGDTTLFVDCADVDAAYAYLRENGVDVERPVTRPYGMRQVSVRDPDGFRVCFQGAVEDG